MNSWLSPTVFGNPDISFRDLLPPAWTLVKNGLFTSQPSPKDTAGTACMLLDSGNNTRGEYPTVRRVPDRFGGMTSFEEQLLY